MTTPSMQRHADVRGLSLVVGGSMGMLDRGADVSWLSQYPHEKEAGCLDWTELDLT
jgi:hypothetical protein